MLPLNPAPTMQFSSTSIDQIRSAGLRDLVSLWDGLAAGRRFPSFVKLKPKRQNFDANQAVIWSIENAGGRRRFRALFNGGHVGEVFNAAFAGKTMEEVIPEPLRQVALEAAEACAATGHAIYTVLRTTDAAGQRIDCERLLLPFGGSAAVVEQVVASLQLSSSAPVQRNRVLENFSRGAEVIFAGRIAAGFGKPAPEAIDAPAPVAAKATSGDHRKAARRKVVKAGKIAFGRTHMTCVVRDISNSGAALEVPNPASLPDRFALVLEMESVKRSCEVVWRKAKRVGVRFG
jgi:hypothetical protein